MNLKFEPTQFILSQAEWSLTDDRIIFLKKNNKGVIKDRKEILLSDITKVERSYHSGNMSSSIDITYCKGSCEFLWYIPSQKKEADIAHEYILSFMSEQKKKDDYRKRCNVCGHIFCYTLADLQKNKELEKQSFRNTLAAGAGALSGYYAAAANSSQAAEDLKSRIVDYDKCPNCGSRNLSDVTNEALENSSAPQETPISVTEELKNFKELLDCGIITQEEFDAKKKQLLGL